MLTNNRYALIAIISKRGTNNVYRILDVNKKKFYDLELLEVEQLEKRNIAGYENFTVRWNEVFPTDGETSRLPVISKNENGNYECIKNDYIIVLNEIVYGIKQLIWGYRVTDYTGIIYDLSLDDFLAYQRVGYHNAKIISENGRVKVVPFYFNIEFKKIRKVRK